MSRGREWCIRITCRAPDTCRHQVLKGEGKKDPYGYRREDPSYGSHV